MTCRVPATRNGGTGTRLARPFVLVIANVLAIGCAGNQFTGDSGQTVQPLPQQQQEQQGPAGANTPSGSESTDQASAASPTPAGSTRISTGPSSGPTSPTGESSGFPGASTTPGATAGTNAGSGLSVPPGSSLEPINGGPNGVQQANESITAQGGPATSSGSISSAPPATSGGQVTACNPSSDFVKLNFPTAIESCIGQNRVWDFYTSTCANMQQAVSFPCTFAGLQQAGANLGTDLTAIIQGTQQLGGKLVSCGESQDGNTIVWETFTPPAGAGCSYTPTAIAAGCYHLVSPDDTSDWSSLASQAQGLRNDALVNRCLQEP